MNTTYSPPGLRNTASYYLGSPLISFWCCPSSSPFFLPEVTTILIFLFIIYFLFILQISTYLNMLFFIFSIYFSVLHAWNHTSITCFLFIQPHDFCSLSFLILSLFMYIIIIHSWIKYMITNLLYYGLQNTNKKFNYLLCNL